MLSGGAGLTEVLAGLFGLLIGSFLNVCIHRWPRDESVVKPRSRCTSCGEGIAWFDNIPVASFMVLRGSCRNCGASIHWRYPVVELLTAACFAFFASQFGLTLETLKYLTLSAILIGLIFSDLETLLLPDEFTIGGLVIGLAFAFFVPMPPGIFERGWVEAVVGAFVPSGVLWLLGYLFEKLRHKEGLGFGDVKMIAMVGAFLGIKGALLTVILGSVLGSAIGLAYIKATSKDAGSYHLPFGTFLGVAGLLAAGGASDWYWRILSTQ